MALPDDDSPEMARRIAQIMSEILQYFRDAKAIIEAMRDSSSAARPFFDELIAGYQYPTGKILEQGEAMHTLHALFGSAQFDEKLSAFRQHLGMIDIAVLDSMEKIRINAFRRDVVLQIPERVGARLIAAQMATFALAFTHHQILSLFLQKRDGIDGYVADVKRIGRILGKSAANMAVPITEPVQMMIELFRPEVERTMRDMLAAGNAFDRIFALREGLRNLLELCAQTDAVVQQAMSAIGADIAEFDTYLELLYADLR